MKARCAKVKDNLTLIVNELFLSGSEIALMQRRH